MLRQMSGRKAPVKKSLVALSALLLLASCGEDDAEVAAKSLRSEIVANSSVATSSSITEEEAGCVADGMVEGIGVEQLQDYDILTEDLKVNQGIENVEMDEGDADALADVFIDCIDTEALFENQLASGSTSAALTADQQDCVSDAVTEDVIKEILAASFQGKRNDAYAGLQEQMMDCALQEK